MGNAPESNFQTDSAHPEEVAGSPRTPEETTARRASEDRRQGSQVTVVPFYFLSKYSRRLVPLKQLIHVAREQIGASLRSGAY